MKLKKTIIGMVHVGALPGTPKAVLSVEQLVENALNDAKILASEGVDAIMIENMHDRPYLNRVVGPEIVATMTAVALAIRVQIKLPLGIQILAGANQEALAVALAANMDFIRAEGFVFGHLADEGAMNSDAASLLRYRKQIEAQHICVYTDIKKKHSSHAVTSDVGIVETAKAASFFLSDGVIVTGSATGSEAELNEVKTVKDAVGIPVLIGSGIDVYNISRYWDFADAFIVGSSLKRDGHWENEVDPKRVREFMKAVNRLK